MNETQLLKYTDEGQGMPIVFLHGFPENKFIWKNFSEKLRDKFRVICLDLPGFGENPALDAPLTITDMAERVMRQLDAMSIDKCVLIGHSLGGYVSLAFAEKYPSRIMGLGLFHSTAMSDSLEKKQGRNRSIDFIERYGINEFLNEFVKPLFYEPRREELKDDINFITEIGKATPKSTIIEVIKAMRDRKDRTKILEKATYPVVFIAGRNDHAINLSTSTPQFWLPADVTIHVLNETCHMGMFERPNETLLHVSQFLEYVQMKTN